MKTQIREYNLFEEIVATLPVALSMPEELLDYDREITNQETLTEAKAVFHTWRELKSGGNVPRLSTSQEAGPCERTSAIDLFFPDFPDASAFAGGQSDPNYIRASVETEIATAKAKRLCRVECPVRRQCLARALEADAEYVHDHGSHEITFLAVHGGWGPGALAKINRKFTELRRTHQREERYPGVVEQAHHPDVLHSEDSVISTGLAA